MADRNIRAEQDGRDFHVQDIGEPPNNPSTMALLKGDLVRINGTEEECTVTIPRLGLWGDSTENGQAWRAWFVAYCEARGCGVTFPDPFKTGMYAAPPKRAQQPLLALPRDTPISFAMEGEPVEETTWGAFKDANSDDVTEIMAVERELLRERKAVMGGGAQPAVFIFIIEHDGGTHG